MASRQPARSGGAAHVVPHLLAGVFVVLLWLAVSITEGNAAIGVMSAAGMLGGLLVLSVLPNPQYTLPLFVWSLALRSVLAVVAWYMAKDTAFAYYTGLNDDSSRYYLYSLLPTGVGSEATIDKAFPAVTYWVAMLSIRLGGAHYLASSQISLVAGSLFPASAYLAVRELLCKETDAKVTGWLVALNPIVIGWSSGLMRDTMVATGGWLMFFGLVAFARGRYGSRAYTFVVLVLAAIVTWTTRAINFFAVTAFASLFLLLRTTFFGGRVGAIRGMVIGTVALGTMLSLFLFTQVGGRIAGNLEFGDNVRTGVEDTSQDPNGISAQIAATGSVLPYFVLAPYAMAQPFPVYSTPVDKHGVPGRIVDYVFNLGGLYNQIALNVFIVGLVVWFRERRWDLFIFAGFLVYAVSVYNLLSAGQTRWMMAAVYPIFFLGVARGFRLMREEPRRAAVPLAVGLALLLLIYAAYGLYKSGLGAPLVAGTLIWPMAFLEACLVALAYQMGGSRSERKAVPA